MRRSFWLGEFLTRSQKEALQTNEKSNRHNEMDQNKMPTDFAGKFVRCHFVFMKRLDARRCAMVGDFIYMSSFPLTHSELNEQDEGSVCITDGTGHGLCFNRIGTIRERN